MKKLTCDRCEIELGTSEDTGYYDVRRNSEYSRFGHKQEKYICENCLRTDERYKKENEILWN